MGLNCGLKKDFSLIRNFQGGSGFLRASYSKSTEGSFSKGKMTASSKDVVCPSFNAKVCSELILPLPHIFS
jgi:hypothetical protein